MGDRLAERFADADIAHDVRVSADFVRVYCDGHHRESERAPLASAGSVAGVYRKPPVLCEGCAELQAYAEKRRAFCPFDPKPFCSECPTHCYKDDRREQMRKVMRYAGPKVMEHRHPIDGIKHVMAVRRSKRTSSVPTRGERDE